MWAAGNGPWRPPRQADFPSGRAPQLPRPPGKGTEARAVDRVWGGRAPSETRTTSTLILNSHGPM